VRGFAGNAFRCQGVGNVLLGQLECVTAFEASDLDHSLFSEIRVQNVMESCFPAAFLARESVLQFLDARPELA
jgi:hypothetical protein